MLAAGLLHVCPQDIVFNHLKEGKTLGFCKDVAAPGSTMVAELTRPLSSSVIFCKASLKEQLAIQAQEGAG